MIVERKELIIAVPGSNGIDYSFIGKSEGLRLTNVEIVKDNSNGVGTFDHCYLSVYAKGLKDSVEISLATDWLHGGSLLWQGSIPAVEPFVLHAGCDDSEVGDRFRLNMLFSREGD